MPLYSYYCIACDEDREAMNSIENRDNSICEECGNKMIRAIDSPGGVWAPTSGKGLAV